MSAWAKSRMTIGVLGLTLLLATASGNAPSAQTALDEESPWPRLRTTNGHSVTLHLPQVESWTSNSFTARAAVGLKPAGAKEETLGVVWFAAHGTVDHSNRTVELDRWEISKLRFPGTPDAGSNALAIIRDVLPSGARTVSLDYLVTALGFKQAAARQGAKGLRYEPPEIIWVTNRTALVLVDGEPVWRPVAGTTLERVINTPALLVRDKPSARLYLSGAGQWFAAGSLSGPWGPVADPPPAIAALQATPTNPPATSPDQPAQRVIVKTNPAELLMTSGLPDYRAIPGTGLQYVADSDSLLFFHTASRTAYLLLSGRWFKAASLYGPWSPVPGKDLPSDFARIPPGSPQGMALSSVPGTKQAELALLSTSVPTTATVNRREAKLEFAYDGEPKLKAIDGTSLEYAVNAPLPVIRAGERYYALDNGVWFTAAAATGPWSVATEVPESIYSIPPSSPVYYATFAQIYEVTDETVETGYTAGYLGAFEGDGTVVYGTGWDYEPYYGEDYYGWGWTWGYNYVYVPWYQWWLWRPWWNEPGGLRAALIENVYDRWSGRNGVTHHDRQPEAPARERLAGSGYPAAYGRFKGASRAVELAPPAQTLALNAYTRPQTPTRPGEVPHGAQLLTKLRQSPGGGRDLYASPDGNVYLRRTDGWYRQDGKNWNFYAPTRGTVERNPAAGPRGTAVGGNVIQPGAGVAAAVRAGRGPDAGFEPRVQDVEALEREYYARSLAQYRADNWRASNNRARPARGGGRRR